MGLPTHCEQGHGVLCSPEGDEREESGGPHAPPASNQESRPVFFSLLYPDPRESVIRIEGFAAIFVNH